MVFRCSRLKVPRPVHWLDGPGQTQESASAGLQHPSFITDRKQLKTFLHNVAGTHGTSDARRMATTLQTVAQGRYAVRRPGPPSGILLPGGELDRLGGDLRARTSLPNDAAQSASQAGAGISAREEIPRAVGGCVQQRIGAGRSDLRKERSHENQACAVRSATPDAGSFAGENPSRLARASSSPSLPYTDCSDAPKLGGSPSSVVFEHGCLVPCARLLKGQPVTAQRIGVPGYLCTLTQGGLADGTECCGLRE